MAVKRTVELSYGTEFYHTQAIRHKIRWVIVNEWEYTPKVFLQKTKKKSNIYIYIYLWHNCDDIMTLFWTTGVYTINSCSSGALWCTLQGFKMFMLYSHVTSNWSNWEIRRGKVNICIHCPFGKGLSKPDIWLTWTVKGQSTKSIHCLLKIKAFLN